MSIMYNTALIAYSFILLAQERQGQKRSTEWSTLIIRDYNLRRNFSLIDTSPFEENLKLQ